MNFSEEAKIITVGAIALLWGSLSLWSQQDKEEIRTELRSFGLDVDLQDVFTEANREPNIRVPLYRVGPEVRYDGPREVYFYRTIEGSDESAAEFLGSTLLNPELRETLLVWTPKEGNTYSILSLPNDLSALPDNHLRFVNTTSKRIGLEIRGGESVILGTGEELSFHTNSDEAIYFWSAMEINGRTGERISNVVEMRPNLRRTVFLTFSNSAATGNDPLGPPRFGFFVVTHD